MQDYTEDSASDYTTLAYKRRDKGKRRRARKQAERFFYLCLLLALFAHLTNPFTLLSVVKDPYVISFNHDQQLVLTKKIPIYVTQNIVYRSIAEAKSGWHILINRLRGGPKTQSASADRIIREIHQKRFNPNEPYLISGDHFSVFYPRSLGIFYNTLLDERTTLDEADWFNRQAIYLKSTAYALSVYDKTDQLSTTIVPIGPNGVTTLNIFSPPSDTLYSLLYALTVLKNNTVLTRLYPFRTDASYNPTTGKAAEQMLKDYGEMLQNHIKTYTDSVYDSEKGLIKSGVVLSGTKDSVIRHDSFYDNVIFWATQKLASDLGLVHHDSKFLTELKDRIIGKYWDDSGGFFREDFSDWNNSQSDNYSSDWLITLMTGFLSPDNPDDLPYIMKSISYIQENGINKPFALRYQKDTSSEKIHTIVKIFAPSYGTTAIWSNWGMEYIKTLLQLYRITCNQSYLTEADYNLKYYRNNMEKYRGFPEVYADSGEIFSQTLYTSVRGTGWVVNFEQASAMYEWTENEVRKQCGQKNL